MEAAPQPGPPPAPASAGSTWRPEVATVGGGSGPTVALGHPRWWGSAWEPLVSPFST